MSGADFKNELIVCCNLCRRFQVKRMIMDQEQFCFIIPFEIFTWIEHEINLPAYKAGIQDLAFVLARDTNTQLSVMNFFDKADSIFNPKFFPDQQQAFDWITANKKEQTAIEPNRPPEVFEPLIDISLNSNKTKAMILLEFPIGSLSNGLFAIKQHLDKMNFKCEKWELFSSLTKREMLVLKLLVKGFQNQEIGNKLNISEKTVKTHRRNLIKKLATRNLIDLYIYAKAFDLI